MTSQPQNLGPGDVIAGKYRVERVLGRGGMGVVLAATHLELGELRALKLLLGAAARTRRRPGGSSARRAPRRVSRASASRGALDNRLFPWGRSIRGGAFDTPAAELRAVRRDSIIPTYRGQYLGFRFARSP